MRILRRRCGATYVIRVYAQQMWRNSWGSDPKTLPVPFQLAPTSPTHQWLTLGAPGRNDWELPGSQWAVAATTATASSDPRERDTR